jgi:hypothetical protein
VPHGLDRCPTLGECLALLDKVVPANDNGEGSNSEILAQDLRRFGVQAKQELLRRAASPNPGWRNVAGVILWSWDSLDPSDVPALRDALRKDPGGWVAKPLGQIGTPDAIKTLVADLSVANDAGNQTGFALVQLGAKAVPFLFPLFQTDRGSHRADSVLRQIGPAALPFLPQWTALALNSGKPLSTRIAALRAIAALGPAAKSDGPRLHPLLAEPNVQLTNEARHTLEALHDPVLLQQAASCCHPKAAPYDSLAVDSLVCLRDVASYGRDAQAVDTQLMTFLASQNGAERSYGITTLGVGESLRAVPAIRLALDDSDWRVTYAATRAL